MCGGPLSGPFKASLFHFADTNFISINTNHKAVQILIWLRSLSWLEEPITQVDAPKRLLTRILEMLLKPAVMGNYRYLMGFAFCECFGARPQIRPTQLDFREGFGMASFGFSWIASTKASLLLALSDERTKILWHPFSEPVNTAAGMFPGTTHC